MTRSLRLTLLLHTTIATTFILGLLGFAVYFSMRRSLFQEFDKSLMARAKALATTIEQSAQGVTFEYDPQQMPEFASKNRPDYFQAWLDGASVLLRSPSLGNGNLRRSVTAAAVYQTLDLPDSRRGRALTLTFTPRTEHDDASPTAAITTHAVVLTVATETTSLDSTLRNLRLLLISLCGLAVLVSGAVLMAVVRHAIRPVERVAGEIDQLNETDLSARLAGRNIPRELDPVVEKLNDLLARLESAFEREKSFTADVAHELRTPVAALQATLDVCRSRPRDVAGYLATIDKCRALTDRMQAMIENLLLLARSESGQLGIQHQAVDISHFLEECWAGFAAGAEVRHVQFEGTIPIGLVAETDAEKLRIVIANLFDNAVCYVNDGGTIRVSATGDAGKISIEVANTGNTIEAAEEIHLFQRFWRGDFSRSDTGLHCGLGLSLCQRLLHLLAGGIAIQTLPQSWFIVRLWLPATPSSVPATPISPRSPSPPSRQDGPGLPAARG